MKRTLALGALAASAALVLSACSGGLASGGETDSGGDFFGAFDDWYAGLWPALGKALGKQVQQAAPAGAQLRRDLQTVEFGHLVVDHDAIGGV